MWSICKYVLYDSNLIIITPKENWIFNKNERSDNYSINIDAKKMAYMFGKCGIQVALTNYVSIYVSK